MRLALSLHRTELLPKLAEIVFAFEEDNFEFCPPENRLRFICIDGETKLFLGCGKKKELTPDRWRILGGALTRALFDEKISHAFLRPLDFFEATLWEGMLFASYQFDSWKKGKDPIRVEILSQDDSFDKILKEKRDLAEALSFTRYLVDENASEVSPKFLADQALAIAKQSEGLFEAKIHGRSFLEEKGFGLLLGVAQGSSKSLAHEPRMILLEYRGDPSSKEWVAILGKGVTYDTGGLNIKPTGGMETMKCDMAGAAAVLGAAKMLLSHPLKLNVVFAVGATYNMVSADSILPGDVLSSYRGLSVEITNTDAEGRLVLADVAAFVDDHYDLLSIIDLATLTGAAELAFGKEFAPVFATDPKLEKALLKAGESVDETLWPMPLHKAYDAMLESKIADLLNSPKIRGGSMNAAACFIKRFVSKAKGFAHLDIAGTAYTSEPRRSYQPTAASGFGMRLIFSFLKSFAREGL